MIFYLLLFASITGFGYIICRKTNFKYRDEVFIFVAFTLLCFLSCIRYDVGFDYSYGGYTGNWREIQNTPFSEFNKIHHEKGFVLFEYFLKLFGKNYQIMYIGTSILIGILAAWFIYKYAADKLWGFFMIYGLGMYYCSMNLIRQTIASLIFAFAIPMAKKKKIIPYMLLTLIAASFHKSALLMIPFYFVLQIKLTKIVLALYSVVTLGIFITSPYILDIVTKVWYGGYVDSIYLNFGNDWFYLITPIMLFIIIYLFREKICEDDSSNNVYISCAFFNLFFYLIGCRHSLVDRFTIYFEPAIILAVCVLMKKLSEKRNDKESNIAEKNRASKEYFVTALSVIVAVLTINFIYLIEDGHGIIPYDTVFTNEDYKMYSQSINGFNDIILMPEDIY